LVKSGQVKVWFETIVALFVTALYADLQTHIYAKKWFIAKTWDGSSRFSSFKSKLKLTLATFRN